MSTTTGTRTGTAGAPLTAVPVRHPGRWVAAGAVVVLVLLLVRSLAANKNVEYAAIGQYLFDPVIRTGVLVTLALTVLAMAIGIVLGVLLAVLRLSPNPVLGLFSSCYIWLFRGTPVLVQLLLWFNLPLLFPKLALGVPFTDLAVRADTKTVISGFIAAMLGLGLNEGAYMAEIVRAGILSVDRGQTEAAQALGMSGALTMRRVVLPQAMRVIVPPTGNEFISMLKTTSLVSVIAGADLLTRAENISSRTFQVMELLIVASIWYLVLTSIASTGQFFLERRFARGSATLQQSGPLLRLVLRAVERRRAAREGTA